jgi:hypothetical protein
LNLFCVFFVKIPRNTSYPHGKTKKPKFQTLLLPPTPPNQIDGLTIYIYINNKAVKIVGCQFKPQYYQKKKKKPNKPQSQFKKAGIIKLGASGSCL